MPRGINSSVDGSEGLGDYLRFDPTRSGAIQADFGEGEDVVEVVGNAAQVRLTFTSAQVGNGLANDSNSMANQDGGLAVRFQVENAGGVPSGTISRFDDEGISFISNVTTRFDVRDLVSGAARGQDFQVVRLGSMDFDFYEEGATTARNTYINAGMGDDVVRTGAGDDFLVGGTGNDELSGRDGDDSFIGGGGNDRIFGGNGDDTAILNVSTDGADQINLGGGADVVNVSAAPGVTQVRLTFTSAEVGDNILTDRGTLANQDRGLAVRIQAEDGDGGLTGPISRADDEGITFVAGAGLTFDVRDLVSGVARGDQFQVATLGTRSPDTFDFSAQSRSYYVNVGGGNDTVTGGSAADFLVGGAGNDRLNGSAGDDSHIGGAGNDVFVFTGTPGNDRILDFVSRTDRIDLSAFDIEFSDLTITSTGGGTLVGVDTNDDGTADFTITLTNNAVPVQSDFLL